MPSLPADEHTFGEWVSSLCDRGLAPTTVQQAMAAVRTAHTMAGHEGQPPTRYADSVLKGYRRQRAQDGAPPFRETPPVTAKALRAMVDTCDVTTLIGCRDHLILVIGFGLMARRSELADLLLQDIVETPEGLDVLACGSRRPTRTPPAPRSRFRAAPGRVPDPVASLARWREALTSRGITTGPGVPVGHEGRGRRRVAVDEVDQPDGAAASEDRAGAQRGRVHRALPPGWRAHRCARGGPRGRCCRAARPVVADLARGAQVRPARRAGGRTNAMRGVL